MDAKPQRPRGLAIKMRDENMPPIVIGQSKGLHHRNKSTPALTALAKPLASNPMIFPQVKRAAFADVSNTFRANGPAKEDPPLSGKGASEKVKEVDALKPFKENPTVQSSGWSKGPILLRPAQRSLSTMNLRSAAAQASVSLVNTGINHAIQVDSGMVAATKRVLGFKPLNAPQKAAKAIEAQSSCQPPENFPSEDINLQRPITVGSSNIPQEALRLPAIPHFDSHLLSEVVPGARIEEIESCDQQGDGVLLPAQPLPQLLHSTNAAVLPSSSGQDLPRPVQDERLIHTETALKQPGSLSCVSTATTALVNSIQHMPSAPQTIEENRVQEENRLPTAPIPSRPGELAPPGAYWDEEEEEEYYDAEGYTTATARSLRLKGDNSTGQVTLRLEPRFTALVEHELDQARLFVQANRIPEEEDDEIYDTSMVVQYGDDIFEYMHDLEEKYRPNPFYMDHQTEIQWSMRSVLMDWMTQVHCRFQLLPETLFLAVNYVDRFLSVKIVSIGKLQLVGACALFIAAKYEEINCPSVQEIIYMVDNGYTAEEILKAERFMLSMLKFELGWPGPMSFLRRISKADDYDLETRTLAKYFLEVMIMDERFVGCVPSYTAAAAHCLARLMLRKGSWTLAHVHYSGYTYWQLHDMLATIVECCQEPRKHHIAVFEKYTEKRYKRAAFFVESEISRGFLVPVASTVQTGSWVPEHSSAPFATAGMALPPLLGNLSVLG